MNSGARSGIAAARRLRVFAMLLAAVWPAVQPQAQTYTISQVPLLVPSALEPNIVLTLDDSAYMQRAYAPDDRVAANPPAANDSLAATRRYKSAMFNPLYYNPSVRYVVPPNGASGNSFGAAFINGFDTSRGSVNLTTGFRPTLLYDPSATSQTFANHASADLVAIGVAGVNLPAPAYYYVYDAGLAGCTNSIGDDNCYRYVRVSATSGVGGSDERQNFANWYSFYRTRNLAMASAAARAMGDASLLGTRVAFQGVTGCNAFNTSCDGWDGNASRVDNRIRDFDATHRARLNTFLSRLGAAGTTSALRTALARVGEYFRTSGVNSPYALNPQVSAGTEYACRPNFHILLAGGVYADSDSGGYCSGTACGDKDGTSAALPLAADPQSVFGSVTGYRPQPPYSDNRNPVNSNSLADVAAYYWLTDLRPDLPNTLIPYVPDRSGGNADAQFYRPRNDPASWQHLVNFTVGIGLVRTLTGSPTWNPTPGDPSSFASLNGSTVWPATNSLTDSGRIYDLWHAAVTSRGQFFGADTPDELVGALTAALSRTIAQPNVATALATNSSRLTNESVLYQAGFDTRDWTGRLLAFDVNADGSQGATIWQATDTGNIPAHGSRNIYTSTGTQASGMVAGAGVALTWPALNAGMRALIDPPNAGNPSSPVLDYLRGDQANEQANGGTYRTRGLRLGDIVNSDLVYAWAESFAYGVLSYNTLESYADFVSNTKAAAARPKMLYVAANDGMLHGFDATSGAERFAYVPLSVLVDPISQLDPRSDLVRLSDPGYTHRYYVDGSPWVGDAWFPNAPPGSRWRSVLVGVTGAGGKGVFALDVTQPGSFSASNVLWDFNGATDPDMGFTLGQPVIGVLGDGNFYAIFGNGYRSANECAVLYLVRLDTGAIRRISTTTQSSCSSAPNGLGRPSLLDVESLSNAPNRITDFIYAGDLRGNLWKFDVSNSNPANWNVAIINKGTKLPLFTAGINSTDLQPITGTLEIGKGPKDIGGAMIYFGTGRFFATDDRTDFTTQTFYGVHDRLNGNQINSTQGDRSMLVGQTINSATRAVSSNPVDYGTAKKAGKLGWFADLPGNGERVVNLPLILPGRLIFSSLIPNSDPCTGGGTSVIQALDPFSGGRIANSIFINGGGDGVLVSAGFIRNLVAIDSGTKVFLYYATTTGQVQKVETAPLTETGGPGRGRTGWREIVK
jgi:type IV pilus assembly protein PilY1